MAGFDDFMKSQSAPVKGGGSASSGGFDAFMKQSAASGHAPDWTDDVKASAKFLGNEVVGVGQALNPYNMAKGLINTVAHPIDTVTGLLNTPGRMIEQYQNGDMEGLAQGIGNIAGTVIGAKVAPQVPGMARTAAETVGTGVDATVAGAKSLASKPIVQAAAPVIAKTLVKGALGAKLGPLGVIAYDMVEDAVASKLKSIAGDKPAATKPVTTNVSTPNASQVSSKAATNALGTKPVTLTESAGKGARTVDNLDPETVQALMDAHNKAGDLRKLPTEVKKDLTDAVKAGDSGKVNDILSKHTSVDLHFVDAENKTNAIVKYVQDHNIDLDQIVTKADRQGLADSAYGHAVKNGMPVKGKYKAISDSTMKAVRDRLAGN